MPEWLVAAISQFSDIIVSPAVYVVLAGIYWCRDKRFGALISLSILTGLNIMELLKNSFCVYRPWIRDARVIPAPQALENAAGYSFPSGHTVQATAQFGTMAKAAGKRRGLRALFTALFLLIGFSRNLLGVHTPQDVLAGFAAGAVCVWLAGAILAWIDRDPSNDIRFFFFCALFSAAALFYITRKPYPAALSFMDPYFLTKDSFTACGSLMGFSAGFAFERRLVRFDERSAKGRLSQIRFLAGGAMMLGIYSSRELFYALIGPRWGRFALFGVLFFFVVAVYPLIFTAFESRFVRSAERVKETSGREG